MVDVEIGAKRRGQFPTTHWSLILAARQEPTSRSREALSSLCKAYWSPLYAWARHQGRSVEDAQDLTQGFIATLLEKQYLADFDRERGRFRSFLLAAFKHYLANEYDRQQAQKRGGGRLPVSLDGEDAENRYRMEPSHNLTPEKIFDRHWALVLLERTFDRLRRESPPSARFDRLSAYLTADPLDLTYSQLAAELKITEGALKVAVHRLRKRFREALRAEIGDTVSRPEEIQDEMRFLLSVLSG